MGTMITPADLTAAGSAKRTAEQGQLFEDGKGRCFMYVKNEGTASTAAGTVVGHFSTTLADGAISAVATTVIECGLGSVMPVAGVALSVIAEDEYGWIQVKGRNIGIILSDGGVAAGDALVCDGGATPTFQADTAVAGEEHGVFGFSLVADDASSIPANSAVINCVS